MVTSNDGALTPSQAANFKVLRRVVFGVGVAIFSYLLWRHMQPGGQLGNVLDGYVLSKWGSAARAFVLALSVLAGLAFLWLASTNIAKALARQVE